MLMYATFYKINFHSPYCNDNFAQLDYYFGIFIDNTNKLFFSSTNL